MIVNTKIFGTGGGVDTSQDTVTASTLAAGVTAHDSNGSRITGNAGLFTFTTSGVFKYPPVVNVPNTVTTLTATTTGLYSHNEIEEIIFESGSNIVYLPQNVFANNGNLEQITMPDTTTIILQGQACSGDIKLETINLSQSQTLKITGANNFYRCYVLTQASFEDILNHLDSTETKIYSGTFQECKAITSVETPSQITTIDGNAFSGCVSLEAAELTYVTQVGAGIFSGCTSLETLVYGAILNSNSTAYINHTSGSNPVYGCTALKDVQIPSGWTENMRLSDGGANWTNVLTYDSMVAMIANLFDYSSGTTHTLTLGATNLARLSASEIAVATNKNWTLV